MLPVGAIFSLYPTLGDPPLGPDSCSRAVTADACNEDRWCACNEDIWCACNEDGWRLVASAAEDGSGAMGEQQLWQDLERVGRGEGNTEGGEGGAGGEGGEGEKGEGEQTVQGGFPGVFAHLWDVDASAVAALLSQVRPTLPGAPYTPTLPGVPCPPTCALPATDAPSPEQVRPLPNRCVLPPTSAPSPPRFSTWTPSSSQQPPPPFPPSFSPLFLQACPPFTDILHLDSQQPCIAPYSATAVVLRADGLAHVGELYAFGKDMSASAVVARLRLSLRLKRKWRPFGCFWSGSKWQGVGIMAASLAGRSFYPSAAYATLNANVDVGRINVVGAGKAPLDDYSGHETAKMRYGDYMSATMDEEGNAWAAVQYVAGQPRTEWSNWGTFVFKCGRLGMGCMGSGADGWGHWTVRGGEGEELGRCLRQARM
ncbi:unnamed protein product [Closterium sp. NIES-65]|nr:unnamed protein product [Closterium sp. NIES-65]